MKRTQGGASSRARQRGNLFLRVIGMVALFLALALAPVAATQPPGFIIGVGMAFDATNETEPAQIAFLYETNNAAILTPGDMILEYRGFPVSSGMDLYQIMLSLPDVAPGDVVPMVLGKANGTVVSAQPVAAAIPPSVSDTTFPDRQCQQDGKDCLCSKVKIGSSCMRRITTVVDANGKFVSTSASCADGVTVCPPAPKPPPKKGK